MLEQVLNMSSNKLTKFAPADALQIAQLCSACFQAPSGELQHLSCSCQASWLPHAACNCYFNLKDLPQVASTKTATST